MSAKSGQSCNSEPIGIRQDGLINGLWSLKNQLTEKASIAGVSLRYRSWMCRVVKSG
jgi:hypothetical protein